MSRSNAIAGLAFALLVGCASNPDVDPRYRPSENVLEVVAVLRRHVPDDTYRFEPARDFTGRNVYRSSLLRLESLEAVHTESLRAGHMEGAMAFAKGRALERLRAFDLATEQYERAARVETALRADAEWSAGICRTLQEARQLGVDLSDISDDGDALARHGDPNDVLSQFESRTLLLESALRSTEGTHYHALVREEVERSDVARARYFIGMRQALPDGDVRAVAELQRVVIRHPKSKNHNRHLLALADLYADLAGEYAEAHPPEGLYFDPVRFQELVDSGSMLYEMVANKDGTSEKLEASRRLEAFLAFALRVDHDRFTP